MIAVGCAVHGKLSVLWVAKMRMSVGCALREGRSVRASERAGGSCVCEGAVDAAGVDSRIALMAVVFEVDVK